MLRLLIVEDELPQREAMRPHVDWDKYGFAPPLAAGGEHEQLHNGQSRPRVSRACPGGRHVLGAACVDHFKKLRFSMEHLGGYCFSHEGMA